MAYRDLREFLARLEAEGELARVEVQVDPRFEVAAVCRKVLNDIGPAVLFEHLAGHDMPLVANLFATRTRYALALEVAPERLTAELAHRLEHPIPPVMVASGPCQEMVFTGEDVDLYRLPIPIWSELDGGPFLTLPCDISKDPETGARNAAIYRSQVFDRRTIGIHGTSYRHLFQHWAKAGSDKPFPMAIAMGCDPTIHIASATPLPFNTDELAMAGGLRGEPVELVPGVTVPLEVPAYSEIVLEGYLQPETRLEGPFGDFLGYYGRKSPNPIMEVTAITHRRHPIMLASFEGRPPHDNALLNSVLFEVELLRAAPLPGLRKVHVAENACGFTAVAAVDNHSEGYARMLGLGLLGTWPGRHIKLLILIDADLDPANQGDVDWALATRFQPSRDVQILQNLLGSQLDPSIERVEGAPSNSLTSKVILDATKFDAARGEKECWPERETWDRVLADWPRYGIARGRTGSPDT